MVKNNRDDVASRGLSLQTFIALREYDPYRYLQLNGYNRFKKWIKIIEMMSLQEV
jgi:hypothetical protein